MIERGSEVGELALHRVEGGAAAGHTQLRPQAFGEHEEVLGVRTANRIRVRREGELGRGELADDLELSHALVADLGQALGHERVEHGDGRVRHRLRGVDLAAAAEHGEPAECLLLVFVEQRVAPLERRPDRALARRRVARTGLQQRQHVPKPSHELLRLEQPDPSGRELDRERKPVESAAQLRDHRRVAVGEPEVRPPFPSPVDEQRDGVRHGERRHRQALLAAQPQRFAARRQHVEPRARRHELAEQRPGVEHVLDVVDHQQGLRAAEATHERVLVSLARLHRHLHGPDQGAGDVGGAATRAR